MKIPQATTSTTSGIGEMRGKDPYAMEKMPVAEIPSMRLRTMWHTPLDEYPRPRKNNTIKSHVVIPPEIRNAIAPPNRSPDNVPHG
jgi:hypothetical protein